MRGPKHTIVALMALCMIGPGMISLSACGFRPVYGVSQSANTDVAQALNTIAIGIIPNQEGQYLRNELIDRFYAQGYPEKPAYALSIDPITERLINLDITRDADSTRGQLRLTINMRLTDTQSRKTVLQRTLTSITSYNILPSEFSTRVSAQNARTNALEDLARQVEMQLGLYFKRD